VNAALVRAGAAVGQQFSCGDDVLTVTSGTLDYAARIVQDARGIFHATGTDVVHDMTVTDGQGAGYSVAGADHFGVTTSDPNGGDPIVETDTIHFAIVDAAGGLAGKVQMTVHLDADGTMRALDIGGCEPPS
jgi:hypothetical protein